MDVLLQLAVVGLTTGAVYGLVALGFTLIFTSSAVLNFAQGEFVMIGALTTALLIGAGVPYLPAAGLAILAGAVAGAVVHGVAVRPLLKREATIITVVLATLASAIIIATGARLLFGTSQRFLPPLISGPPFNFFGAAVARQSLVILLLMIPLVAVLWGVFYRTDLGLQLRAAGFDRGAAGMLGVNVGKLTVVSFAVSGAIGALGGILIGPLISASPAMGIGLAVVGFIAAVTGGIGNPIAAVLGGIVVGLMEAFVAGYVSSALTQISVFLLLPIVLLFRPNGFFQRG